MRSRLNVLLAERRMSKKRLGEVSGVSRTTLWSMSGDGIGNVTLGKAASVASALGVKVDELFEDEPDGGR